MNEYLTRTLLPLIVTIQPKKSESYTLDALGLERQSSQSILITFGERIERFWNTVISDSKSNNLIEDVNMVDINGKDRQIDHNFECYLDALNYYLTFFNFGNTTSDPNQHKPCSGTRPLTYAALDT